MAFCVFGQAAVSTIFFGFLKLFEGVDMDDTFPKSRSM
jgi:hypothetical protein